MEKEKFRHLQVKRDHEEHGVEQAGVNVTTNVFIIEGDVHPSTGTGQICSHIISVTYILLIIYLLFSL